MGPPVALRRPLLSERGGRQMPPVERSALYAVRITRKTTIRTKFKTIFLNSSGDNTNAQQGIDGKLSMMSF